MKFLIIFSLVLILNFIWSKCTIYTAKGNAGKASVCAGTLTLISSAITITYVEDHRMVIPAAIGALIGTFLAVKLENK